MTEPDWYRTFFSGVALDLWRHVVTPEQTRAEAAFLAETLAPYGAARLLDVPCGNGRHAIALAELGHRVTGVDLSEEFVAEARARAEGRAVEIVHADMRALAWDAAFAGAYCWGNSFGYLPHAGTIEFLAAVARALAPGGRFVLHTGTAAECLLPSLVDKRTWQVGDIEMRVANHYVVAESRLDTEFTFIRGGARDVRTACHHVYTVAELRRLLEHAGLRVASLYGSVARAPFAPGTPELIVVAEKAR
jgi:SAM-dependent methyltransferase